LLKIIPLRPIEFISPQRKTFEAIADMPGIGTAYRSKRAKLHGLRFFPLTQYPNYVVYYREIDNGIEIVRVLHAHMEKERRLET